jgi:hypothetical protein
MVMDEVIGQAHDRESSWTWSSCKLEPSPKRTKRTITTLNLSQTPVTQLHDSVLADRLKEPIQNLDCVLPSWDTMQARFAKKQIYKKDITTLDSNQAPHPVDDNSLVV